MSIFIGEMEKNSSIFNDLLLKTLPIRFLFVLGLLISLVSYFPLGIVMNRIVTALGKIKQQLLNVVVTNLRSFCNKQYFLMYCQHQTLIFLLYCYPVISPL